MRTVEVTMSFAGEVFVVTMKVPEKYFRRGGRLDEKLLKNRLEVNPLVHYVKTLEER